MNRSKLIGSPLVRRIVAQLGAGSGSGGGGGPPLWTVDSISGIGTPLDETESEALLDDAGQSSPDVSNLWIFGAPTGGGGSTFVNDVIGGKHLDPGTSSIDYQATVSGWTMKSARMTDGIAGLFENTAMPNCLANSLTLFVLAKSAASLDSNPRTLFRYGTSFDGDACAEIRNGSPVLQVGRGGTSSRTAGLSDPTGVARWHALRVDDGATTVDLFTSQEKIIGGTKNCSGTRITFGGDFTQTWWPCAADYLLAFLTPIALTNVVIKNALISLGEAPGWSP